MNLSDSVPPKQTCKQLRHTCRQGSCFMMSETCMKFENNLLIQTEVIIKLICKES